MRSGDRPGLQNRRVAGNPVTGGFDPHSLPPIFGDHSIPCKRWPSGHRSRVVSLVGEGIAHQFVPLEPEYKSRRRLGRMRNCACVQAREAKVRSVVNEASILGSQRYVLEEWKICAAAINKNAGSLPLSPGHCS